MNVKNTETWGTARGMEERKKIKCALSCSHLSFGKLYFIINFHIFGTCGYGHIFYAKLLLSIRRFDVCLISMHWHCTHTLARSHGWLVDLHHRIFAGSQPATSRSDTRPHDTVIHTHTHTNTRLGAHIFIYLFIFEINNICRCAFSLSRRAAAWAGARARKHRAHRTQHRLFLRNCISFRLHWVSL